MSNSYVSKYSGEEIDEAVNRVMTGDGGFASTITIGTVTTGAAGTAATVTNAGTSINARLNFRIPQGAAGKDGTDGVNGTNGKDGADGKSAYEVAVQNSFTGTETQWLASLVGAQGKDGTDGKDGANGADGLSAYEIAVQDGFTGTETEWLESLVGETGADGKDGTGVTILGSYDSEDELKAAHPTGSIGDSYMVNGDLYIWSENQSEWVNVGSIRGETGAAGTDGKDGVSPTIAVKENTSTSYILSITDADGTIETPNLRGKDGDTLSSFILRITFDAELAGGIFTVTGGTLSYSSTVPDTLTAQVSATDSNTLYTVECGEYTGAVETTRYFGFYDVELSGLEAVGVPTQSGTLTYTGSIQSPTWTGYDSEKMTLSGTTSGTNAGSYTATFTPASGYKWTDGTTTAKNVTWTISKAVGSLTINPTSLNITGALGTTGTIAVTRIGDGAVTAVSSDTGVATASVSGTTVTVTSVASGSATVTVSVSEGTNYTAPASATCSVTASETPDIPANFADATWQEISYASQNNLIPAKWQVGGEKDETLSTGETLTFQIYDFNHDPLADGSGYAGITIGIKNLMADPRQMNSTSTNVGSFTGSELYAWLTGDLWDSLPSDLQAVIRPVKKYTSAGNKSTTILTETMSIFLFSEVELFGSVTHSVAGEGTQYPIFTDNASRIKYLSNGDGSVRLWWGRSPSAPYTTAFCATSAAGASAAYDSTSVSGINFGFCI